MRDARRFPMALVGIVLVTATLLPAAPASAATSAGKPITLGTGDDQSVITVHVGDTIEVSLKPDGPWQWSAPTSSDPSVLRLVSGARGSGHRRHHHHKATGSQASFRALAAGMASLESVGSIACKKGHVCPATAAAMPAPLLARLWHVDVTVE